MTSIYDAELLLVDDNPDLLRLLCEQLSGAGYHHIRTAVTCAAARVAFDASPHGMPMQTGCSGWALAQTII